VRRSTEKVQRALESFDDLSRANMGRVGDMVFGSARALRTNLDREQTRYSVLLRAERSRRLVLLLEINSRPDMALVAKHIGYSCADSAGRAFRDMMGKTLRQHKGELVQ
jgi:transcriptional regulator GlxA family with amidase domain